jgi:predicted DNA-binding protein with PD1-like motif
VEKSRKGDILIIRLSDGEDVFEGMSKALKDEGIHSGVIIGGVGMVKDTALSFYRGRGEYEIVPLSEEAELCGLNGNVSTIGDELVIHMHAAVGRRGGSAMAGHLSSGRVNLTAEIAVMVVAQKLTRQLDPATGLRTLAFE